MSLTLKVFGPADYHQVTAYGPVQSGVVAGDIIDLRSSLHNRSAETLMVESIGGSTVIRLNVVERVYGRQYPDNRWIMESAFYTRPLLIDIRKVQKDDIVIGSGVTWSASHEIALDTVEIVTVSSGTKLTFM